MASSKDDDAPEGEQPTNISRKKRLSRREQKARKKQRKQLDHKEVSSPHQDEPVKKDSKKSKKKKRKRHEKDQKKGSSPRPEKSAKTDTKESESETPSGDAWKAAPAQEDVPYVPTTIPDLAEARGPNDKKNKTLGKWFPKARVVKSLPSETEECTILLFYQYKSPLVWSESRVAQLMQYLQAIAEARPTLGGRLRVAPEGINATLSCGDAKDEQGNIVKGRTILEHFTKDMQQFDEVFCETDFKYIPAKADRHFKDLKILPVQELVFYGLQEKHAPLGETGVHLDAKDFHDMLQDKSKETVVVDVRNHYEAALGRFDGQEKVGGAAYIDPLMRKSTDFPSWLEKAADDLKGKRVMMYCTGGVRCERASAYLKKTMGDSVDGVFQLQGGIERYMQAFPDGGHWRGSNFVFDKRESVSAENPNGDGGVVKGKKKKKPDEKADDIQSTCCLCERPWNRYVGKKKCETCGVPVLMCDTCMSTHRTGKKKQNKKDEGDNNLEEPRKMARCPLCVTQNITVPVEEVEYTDNGVKSKSHSDQGKAAPSVLKWGGGHATEKKEQRRRNRKQFGAESEGSGEAASQAEGGIQQRQVSLAK